MILESETCSIAFENEEHDDVDEYSLPNWVVHLRCHYNWCLTSPSMPSSFCSDDFETRFSPESTTDSRNAPVDHDLGRSGSDFCRIASLTPTLAVGWREHGACVSRRKQTDDRQISMDRPLLQPIDTCRIERTFVQSVVETLENKRIESCETDDESFSLTGKSRVGTMRWLIPWIANRCWCRCVRRVGRVALLAEIVRIGSCLTGEVRCCRIGIERVRYRCGREMTCKGVLIECREEWIVVGRGVIVGRGGRRCGSLGSRRTGSGGWRWGIVRHGLAWKIGIVMVMIEMISNNVNQTETRRGKKMKHWPLTVFVRESEQDERCSEDALRKLSRSIEEVRLHSQHRQICACICVLLVRSHSFLFFRTHTQKRPLVYVLRIIISFLSPSLFLSFWHSFSSSSIFHWWKRTTHRIGRQGEKKRQAREKGEKQVLLSTRPNTYRRC